MPVGPTIPRNLRIALVMSTGFSAKAASAMIA